MDFNWSEEQIAFKASVTAFAKEQLGQDLFERDREGRFSREDWKRCADFGIQGMAVPEAHSGSPPRDILSGMLSMEAFGYGCCDNGLAFGLNAQMWTVQLPIQQHGTEKQQARYLPKMCTGDWIGAHALTEPESGSDAFGLQTHARKCRDGYVLNGTKTLITFGPIADVALLFATIDPKLGKWGVTAFLVERSFEGYHAGSVQDKMGLRTVPIGEITLKDCFVPEENRLGPEGAGAAISLSSLEYERCCILASQLGAMERQLEESVEFARTRQQFDHPIGKFQSVSNRIADMKVRLETARLMLYKVAWLKSQGRSAMMEAAMLKLYLSEQFVDSGLDAIRIHGGRGYMSQTGIERDLRDAIGGVLYAGTSDIQRNIIAGLLGL